MPIIGKGQKQACPEFSPWEKLMKKENYEEANRIARLVYDYKTPDSWEKKDVRIQVISKNIVHSTCFKRYEKCCCTSTRPTIILPVEN